jgi:hypothetical protein
VDNGNKKEEPVSTQININGKLDTLMNLILTNKSTSNIQPGSLLLFTNGDNVNDISKNPIYITSGSGIVYKLSGLADPEYDLYNKKSDYIIDLSSSSVPAL